MLGDPLYDQNYAVSTMHKQLREQADQQGEEVLGLYYLEELTMKEVGLILDIGESRVSQIHTAAILRLRSRLREKLEAQHRAQAEVPDRERPV